MSGWDLEKGCYGVRVHYIGHGDHIVSTCAYRTTEENKRACFSAIAILEAMTVEALQQTIEREWATVKVELYRAYGASS